MRTKVALSISVDKANENFIRKYCEFKELNISDFVDELVRKECVRIKNEIEINSRLAKIIITNEG